LFRFFLGDPVWVPTLGGGGGGVAAGGIQWIAGPAVVHQDFSPDRKAREIKITSVKGESRILWKDYVLPIGLPRAAPELWRLPTVSGSHSSVIAPAGRICM
jgi:hypothetical protein